MFWNKKKELIIQKRINTLYRKIETIIDTKTTAPVILRSYKECNYNNCQFETFFWLGFKLNTKYGKRCLLVRNNELFYGEFSEDIDFFGNLKIHPKYEIKQIFNIKIFNSEVIIEPKPMVKLTPKEIDLAILEFEQAIQEKYQIAKTKKLKHQECIEYFSNESEE